MGAPLISRRAFLARFGGAAAAAAALAAVPDLLRWKGWYHAASAQEPDVVLDTFNGVAAMVWPGDDPYSQAQGESADRPGAVAANAGRHILEALDDFVPFPAMAAPVSGDGTVPLSGAIASTLNTVALTVDPAAAGGPFLSPFARLRFADKVETWRVLEEDAQAPPGLPADLADALAVTQFAFGVLPGFVLFFAFSEIDVLDRGARTLTRRPVGWDHAGYLGGRLTPVEGWDELKGFYQDRREVIG